MGSATPDILQNHDSFTVPAYRARTAPLVEVLRARWLAPGLWTRLRRSPWASGLLMFLSSRGFRVAVTIGHRPALVFGALRRLLGRGEVLHVAKEFYIEEAADTPRRGWRGLLQRLKRAVYRWALKDVAVLVVNARAECDAYARFFDLPRGRVTFLPWPSNIDEPHWYREHDGTILAGGRSLRDWRTFFEAVGQQLSATAHIIPPWLVFPAGVWHPRRGAGLASAKRSTWSAVVRDEPNLGRCPSAVLSDF